MSPDRIGQAAQLRAKRAIQVSAQALDNIVPATGARRTPRRPVCLASRRGWTDDQQGPRLDPFDIAVEAPGTPPRRQSQKFRQARLVGCGRPVGDGVYAGGHGGEHQTSGRAVIVQRALTEWIAGQN